MINYKVVTSLKDVGSIPSELVIDLETTSLETHSPDNKILGIGLCWKGGEAFYIDLHDLEDSRYDDILREVGEKIVSNPEVRKIGHNIKFDARVFHAHGLPMRNIYWDTQSANYVLKTDTLVPGGGKTSGHKLDDCVLYWLNHIKIRTKKLIPKKSKKNPNPSLAQADQSLVAFYCMEDVDFTFRLYEMQKEALSWDEYHYAREIFEKIDRPLVQVVTDMECHGVKFDRDSLESYGNSLRERKTQLLEELSAIAGETIEPTLPRDQLEHVIYDVLKLPEKLGVQVRTTPSGARSVDRALLDELSKKSEWARTLLETKQIDKILGTYVRPFLELSSRSVDGLAHPDFNLTATATGRLSASYFQNIPIRSDVGKGLRAAIVSKHPGGKILDLDWGQMEIRILAHISGEEFYRRVFEKGDDPHRAVAAAVMRKRPEEVTDEERSRAKAVNFGIIYRMGPKKLSESTGMSYDQAIRFIDSFNRSLPSVNSCYNKTISHLREKGYTETIFGRRRYFPEIWSEEGWIRNASERAAWNHPIQGTNGDIAKLCMIRFHSLPIKSHLILQVHDELVVDVPPEELDSGIDNALKDIMLNTVPLSVPLEVDGGFGNNWLEAH